MALAPANAIQQSPVVNMDEASALIFEECVAKLNAISESVGQPVSEISGHPALRPIFRKMRSLLEQMDSFDPSPEDNLDGHIATVTHISTRFQAN